jgi:hypothetical protein
MSSSSFDERLYHLYIMCDYGDVCTIISHYVEDNGILGSKWNVVPRACSKSSIYCNYCFMFITRPPLSLEATRRHHDS